MTCGHKLVSAAEFWSRLQRCFLTLDVYKSWTEEVQTGKRQSTVRVSGAGTAAHFYSFSTWGMILNIQLKRPESSSWAGSQSHDLSRVRRSITRTDVIRPTAGLWILNTVTHRLKFAFKQRMKIMFITADEWDLATFLDFTNLLCLDR